ncbi:hypothetical protein GCM10010844_28630 [Deinococcus radiotolerans]|uniref:histidine kinase n=2 Tax=Deinococcus radiotolerans TaxID=1309407 RepID=A0ABQ2FKX3_9DEIO|nr:hypothetical protein GCM10010844_28630 [Deinococcus radiotolerans]
MVILDLDARLLSLNQRGLDVLGIPDFPACHLMPLTSFWSGEAGAQLESALGAARSGESRTFAGPGQTFTGAPRWWSVTVAPLRDEAGQVTYLLAALRDVTAQTTTELARQGVQANLHLQAQGLERRVQEQTLELEARATALDAFVRFTEAVGTDIDQRRLAQQAAEVVQAHVHEVSVAYYELDAPANVWRRADWSGNERVDVVTWLPADVPVHAPEFSEAVRRGEPVFVEGRGDAPVNPQDFAAGFAPVTVRGEVSAIIAVGRPADRWTARDQAIVRAVVRGLSLALERAEQALELTRQRDDLDRRAQQLETLLLLTEDQGEAPDPLTLIGRAQELVLELLPPGFAAYYEAQGGRWQVRVQTGEARSAAMQALIDAGFPVGTTPSFDQVAHSSEPAFVDVYDTAADVDPAEAQDVAAHATLPLITGGRVRGLFNVPLFGSRSWNPSDEAVLITTMQHLGVVIERLERSAQLIRSNAELQASNQELEAFTYSVSHDLRTPVRHVEGFATLALKELERGDVARAERHLRVVVGAAERMESVLDAMLTLSRAGRSALTVQAVCLTELVDQVLKDVTLLDPDHAVTWTVDPLPVVQGDPGALEQICRHLLENAVKFSPGPARVHVWAQERPQEWALFVQDDGVGFDPVYAGRLFGAFQRLHTQREFAGAGIGLATVKRLVTRHGGQVWAEGRAGQGATFGFTLPKTPGP